MMNLFRIQAHSLSQFFTTFKYPITLFIVARVALSLWAIAVFVLLKPPAPIEVARNGAFYFQPIDSGLGYYLLEPWNRWDTNWYLKIAAQGYSASDGSMAFFPLYPLLIRIFVTALGGQWLFAALVVSNLAALGSLVILYRMIVRQFGEGTARRALFFLLVFPMAFFLFAGYSESLFLFFALAALENAQESRWARAGIANGLCILTRAPGVLLIVPLLFEFGVQFRQRRARLGDLIPLGGLSAIGAGYPVYLAIMFGDVGGWSRSVVFWRVSGLPGQSIVATIQMLVAGSGFGIANNLVDLSAALFFVVLIIWGAFCLPLPLTLYSLAVILPPLASVQTVVPMLPLASLPRYGIVAFPIFVLLALTRKHPRLEFLFVVIALVLQALFTALFVKWIWIA